MLTFLTKLQGILQKPLVRKIVGPLLEDVIPKLRARVGEDPVIAFGGLATFLAWLAGRVPKIAKPLQGAVALLAILGAKATVTPTANPKAVILVPVEPPAPPAPAPAAPAGAKPAAPAKPEPPRVVKVTVPLVPATPSREAVQDAVSDAVAKLKRRAAR